MQDFSNRAERIAAEIRALGEKIDRRRFIDDACQTDVLLKQQVERLLGLEHGNSEDTKAEPMACEPSGVPSVPEGGDTKLLDDSGEGSYEGFERREDGTKYIGPYTIVGKLGEGGFGNVYHARQSEPVRRDVAVKVLKKGMDSRQILGRFEIERQTLAMMDHSGIAKIFDAGRTSTGQPYFVMELVKGIPITKYCNNQKLPIDERVRLFIDVCHAVQHAHHKGVIHRDLKPSNILVTIGDERAKPVVIDFGVAKTTQGPLGEQTVVTQMHQVIGTPLYMSPEQAEMSSLDIDTRADIYSLGVILYELLCGTTPFSRESLRGTALSVARKLQEVDPPRPSQRLTEDAEKAQNLASKLGETSVSLQRSLRSELDWIVMKCLEKQRGKRYPTVSGLAQDLQRYLDDEPVQARRSTVVYSLQKLAAKHRLVAISALLIFASMATGTVVSMYMYFQAQQRARDVLRLADLNEIISLEQEIPGLVTTPLLKRKSQMRSWLDRVQVPMARIDDHRRTLERLTAIGRRENSKDVFATLEYQWQFDNQQELVQRLKAFSGSQGRVAQVQRWHNASPSEQAMKEAWARCMADLEKTQPTWQVKERFGLYPIGKSPHSGLWEFVDLNTGLAPTDTSAMPEPTDGVVYVLVPGGTFMMGSPPEEAGRAPSEHQHPARVSPFLIAKYEFTQAQWIRIMGFVQKTEFPGELKPTAASWFEARDCCLQIMAELPTEAQWEFACRAHSAGPYAGSIEDLGWFDANSAKNAEVKSDKELKEIGRKMPNDFNLFDMHGNAHEWVFDAYDKNFYHSPEAQSLDPVRPPRYQTHYDWTLATSNFETEEEREVLEAVLRGGTYNGKASYCRSANRYHEEQVVAFSDVGFRPCIDDLITVVDSN